MTAWSKYLNWLTVIGSNFCLNISNFFIFTNRVSWNFKTNLGLTLRWDLSANKHDILISRYVKGCNPATVLNITLLVFKKLGFYDIFSIFQMFSWYSITVELIRWPVLEVRYLLLISPSVNYSELFCYLNL